MSKPSGILTIATVVFNDRASIEQTIQSVLPLKEYGIEYIVIDGGSTDGTINIIKEYEPFIDHWISEPDRGIYDAMNKAAKLANGKYLYFLNSNDLIVEESFKLVLKKEIALSDYDVYYGNVLEKSTLETLKSKDPQSIKYQFPFCHQGLIIKRSIYLDHPFQLEYSVAADYDVLFKCYNDGRTFYKLEFPLALYDMNGYSVTSSLKAYRQYYKIIYRNNKGLVSIYNMVRYSRLNMKRYLYLIIMYLLGDSLYRKLKSVGRK